MPKGPGKYFNIDSLLLLYASKQASIQVTKYKLQKSSRLIHHMIK